MIYPCVYQTANGIPRDLGSLLALRSQGFGENVAYYQQYFGTNGHAGMDWPCVVGTPAYAAVAGRISWVATDFHVESGSGAGIIIETPEGDCVEWHFSRVDVKVGDVVSVGQQVGLTGDSGASTGPHIHLEWRPLPLAYYNGFYGAVDFQNIMVWKPLPQSTKTMTEQEVDLLYEILDINDPDGSGRAYWIGKPVGAFLHEFAKNKAAALLALSQ